MTAQIAIALEAPADAPRLWEDAGGGWVCSWCGAASVEDWHRFDAERDEEGNGPDCQRCHFHPSRRKP